MNRRRRLTVEQIRRIRAWKPLKALAAEMGISERTAQTARRHHYKSIAV